MIYVHINILFMCNSIFFNMPCLVLASAMSKTDTLVYFLLSLVFCKLSYMVLLYLNKSDLLSLMDIVVIFLYLMN